MFRSNGVLKWYSIISIEEYCSQIPGSTLILRVYSSCTRARLRSKVWWLVWCYSGGQLQRVLWSCSNLCTFDHAPASSSIMHQHMVLLPLAKRNTKSCRHEQSNKDFWITLVYRQSILLIEYGHGGIYDQQITGAAHLISVTPADSFITKEIVLISAALADSSITTATDLRNWDGGGWFGRYGGAVDTS